MKSKLGLGQRRISTSRGMLSRASGMIRHGETQSRVSPHEHVQRHPTSSCPFSLLMLSEDFSFVVGATSQTRWKVLPYNGISQSSLSSVVHPHKPRCPRHGTPLGREVSSMKILSGFSREAFSLSEVGWRVQFLFYILVLFSVGLLIVCFRPFPICLPPTYARKDVVEFA